jgi:hypothetical protein
MLLVNFKDDPEHAMAMYQYFVKVVPTVYESLGGNLLNTNQFSVTEYFKPLKGEQGHGLPGNALCLKRNMMILRKGFATVSLIL